MAEAQELARTDERPSTKVNHVPAFGRTEQALAGGWSRRFRRFGALGLAFFALKGLLWLVLPALLAYFGAR